MQAWLLDILKKEEFVRLHGSDYGYRYARTTTETGGSTVAYVGSFGGGFGLRVVDMDRSVGNPFVWVAPLGVHAQE